MSVLLDTRPGGLDCFYRPGDPFRLDITWPAGFLAGRTFTSTLGAASLGVSVLGDVMTLTATAAQTTAAAVVSPWELIDTTPAEDVTLMVGRWAADDDAASPISTTVTVSTSAGAVAVSVVGPPVLGKHPLVFWQHPVTQTLPNAAWSPMAWNSLLSTVGEGWTTYVPASTTIAVGSNGAVLPQATINLTDASGLAAAGYTAIRISGKDTVVQYTSHNATQILGCTGGSGTLATGQAVAQANVEFNMPVNTVGPLIAELAWASSATGLRGTRLRALNALGAGFHLNGGTDVRAAGVASADPLIRSIANEQPAYKGATIPLRIEGYQSSTGPLDVLVDQLAAPRLVIQALSAL